MLSAGRPFPLGATLAEEGGANFALAAPDASFVELCLFEPTGQHEQQRLRLPACTDGIWHGRLPAARPGLVYGLRVHGPWAPHEGRRFNPSKLLLDPYAREIVGAYGGEDLFLAHVPGRPQERDTRDNAAVALKAPVAPPPPPGRSLEAGASGRLGAHGGHRRSGLRAPAAAAQCLLGRRACRLAAGAGTVDGSLALCGSGERLQEDHIGIRRRAPAHQGHRQHREHKRLHVDSFCGCCNQPPQPTLFRGLSAVRPPDFLSRPWSNASAVNYARAF